VTLADAKAYMGIDPTVTTYDDLIQGLINAVTAHMEAKIAGPIKQRSFTDTYDGTGLQVLPLRHIPVQAVTQVTVDGQAVDISQIYVYQSFLEYANGFFNQGYKNVTVVATVGWNPVPDDLVLACKKLVAIEFMKAPAGKNWLAQKSQTLSSPSGNLVSQFDPTEEDAIWKQIATYRQLL